MKVLWNERFMDSYRIRYKQEFKEITRVGSSRVRYLIKVVLIEKL